MNETKPHVIVRAIGWAILITSLWSWIGFVLGWYWSFPIIFLCVFGIVLSAPLETVLSSRERWNQHLNYIKRTRLELSETVTKSVTNETETKTATEIHTPEQKAAWRGYWSKVLGYASVSGGVAYRRLESIFGNDSEKWKECFAVPMVKQRWFTSVEQGVTTETTIPIPEILEQLAKGVTPPPPNTRSWPPEIYQQSTVPTPETPPKKRGNSRATVVNSTDTDNTVYASEAK